MPSDRSTLARHLLAEYQLQQRLTREYLITGIKSVDGLFGGFPRGAITEVYGSPSSGKTTLFTGFLAQATREGEFCALVDSRDAFNPASAASAKAELKRLLWVRCRQPEQALKSADLLLHSGGWGVVMLDLSDAPQAWMQRLPVSYWYRFRRAVEETPTVFLVLTRQPCIKNCAAMSLEMPPSSMLWSGDHSDFLVLKGIHSRLLARKPMRTGNADFRARAIA